MSTNSQDSKQFRIGDFSINRLGFGAMRITGPGIWGEPEDRQACLDVLKKLPELDVNFIDTADSYGPNVSEELIREALHPYSGLLIATKGGLTRHGPDIWAPLGRPEYLRQCVLMSIRRLGVEQIDLWQLHRIDAKVPQDEQFNAIQEFQKEGLIKHVGLSEVNVDEITAAQKYFKVVTVQNQYNLTNRTYEDVVDYCDKNGIGFIPWFPLAKGDLTKTGVALNKSLDEIAHKHEATPAQIAVAWLLKRSPVIIPIPGTSKVSHLIENVKASSINMSDAEFNALSLIDKSQSNT